MSSSKLSDFIILDELGRGTYGVVHKVRRLADDRIYVIKQVNIGGMSAKEQQDVVTEVHILAALDNKYIVRYYDSFIENSMLNIVMEIADGGTLQDRLKKLKGRKLSELAVWNYFIQICLGLYYIHSLRILHRDIKSMNIFLTRDDVVKIGDFGVAKILNSTNSMAQTLVGTPYYLSPELCENKPYGEKSDIWALGCILYEMCTLKHPFDANNQGALILKILRGKFAPIGRDYSAEMSALLKSCLARDSLRRPTAEEIIMLPVVLAKCKLLNIELPAPILTKISPPQPPPPLPVISLTAADTEIPNEPIASVASSRKPAAAPRAKCDDAITIHKQQPRSVRVRRKPGTSPPTDVIKPKTATPRKPAAKITATRAAELPIAAIDGIPRVPQKRIVVMKPTNVQQALPNYSKRPTARDLEIIAKAKTQERMEQVQIVADLPTDMLADPQQQSMQRSPRSASSPRDSPTVSQMTASVEITDVTPALGLGNDDITAALSNELQWHVVDECPNTDTDADEREAMDSDAAAAEYSGDEPEFEIDAEDTADIELEVQHYRLPHKTELEERSVTLRSTIAELESECKAVLRSDSLFFTMYEYFKRQSSERSAAILDAQQFHFDGEEPVEASDEPIEGEPEPEPDTAFLNQLSAEQAATLLPKMYRLIYLEDELLETEELMLHLCDTAAANATRTADQ